MDRIRFAISQIDFVSNFAKKKTISFRLVAKKRTADGKKEDLKAQITIELLKMCIIVFLLFSSSYRHEFAHSLSTGIELELHRSQMLIVFSFLL